MGRTTIKLKKNAQTTAFVVVGLIVFILFVLLFYVYIKSTPYASLAVVEEKQQAKSYNQLLKGCLEEVFACSLYHQGLNNGEFVKTEGLPSSERFTSLAEEYVLSVLPVCLGKYAEEFQGFQVIQGEGAGRVLLSERASRFVLENQRDLKKDERQMELSEAQVQVNATPLSL